MIKHGRLFCQEDALYGAADMLQVDADALEEHINMGAYYLEGSKVGDKRDAQFLASIKSCLNKVSPLTLGMALSLKEREEEEGNSPSAEEIAKALNEEEETLAKILGQGKSERNGRPPDGKPITKNIRLDLELFEDFKRQLSQFQSYGVDCPIYDRTGEAFVEEFGTPPVTLLPKHLFADDLLFLIGMAEGVAYRKPVSSPQKYQVVMLDASGSMSSTEKMSCVVAALEIILKRENTSSMVCTFEEEIMATEWVKTEEDATNYIHNIKRPRAGNTDVGRVLKEARNLFKQQYEDAAVYYVINDGEDVVEMGEFDEKIIGLSLFNQSPTLIEFIKQNNGIQLFLEEDTMEISVV